MERLERHSTPAGAERLERARPYAWPGWPPRRTRAPLAGAGRPERLGGRLAGAGDPQRHVASARLVRADSATRSPRPGRSFAFRHANRVERVHATWQRCPTGWVTHLEWGSGERRSGERDSGERDSGERRRAAPRARPVGRLTTGEWSPPAPEHARADVATGRYAAVISGPVGPTAGRLPGATLTTAPNRGRGRSATAPCRYRHAPPTGARAV